MKLVKKLTKANCEKYGIEVAPELDFNDDGNKFRGFIYNGMPMTQCYADGTCYLCIRVDYLRNNNFTYSEWMATDEYHLCDAFNGVNEFDIDELIENLEKVIAKVEEMNNAASISKDELEEAKNIARSEVEVIENFVENVKANFKWWDVKYSAYIKTICGYMDTLDRMAKNGKDRIATVDFSDIRSKKEFIEKGRNAIKNPNCKMFGGKFYMDQITYFMNK